MCRLTVSLQPWQWPLTVQQPSPRVAKRDVHVPFRPTSPLPSSVEPQTQPYNIRILNNPNNLQHQHPLSPTTSPPPPLPPHRLTITPTAPTLTPRPLLLALPLASLLRLGLLLHHPGRPWLGLRFRLGLELAEGEAVGGGGGGQGRVESRVGAGGKLDVVDFNRGAVGVLGEGFEVTGERFCVMWGIRDGVEGTREGWPLVGRAATRVGMTRVDGWGKEGVAYGPGERSSRRGRQRRAQRRQSRVQSLWMAETGRGGEGR